MPRFIIGFAKAITYLFKLLGIVLELRDIYQTGAWGIVIATSAGTGVGLGERIPWWYALLLGIGVFLVSFVGIALFWFRFKQWGKGKYTKLPEILRDMDDIMGHEALRQSNYLNKHPQKIEGFAKFITRWTGATQREKDLLLQSKPLSIATERRLGQKWYKNMRTTAPEIIFILPDICKETGIGLGTLDERSLRYALLSQQLRNLRPLPSSFSDDVELYLRLLLVAHTHTMLQVCAKELILERASPDVTIFHMNLSIVLKALVDQQLVLVNEEVAEFLETPRKEKGDK